MVNTTLLQNGESVGMGILKINSIPSISILTDDVNLVAANERITLEYKKDMANLLTEVYQQYKERTLATGTHQDIALEFLWLTAPVQNQPYKANITLYLIIRSINRDRQEVEKSVASLFAICRSALTLARYEFEDCAPEAFVPVFNRVREHTVRAIVKEERLEDLQVSYFPVCYAFDPIPPGNQDLSRIVNVLIDYPDSAVSFQLIPTFYTAEEKAELGTVSQSLSTLSRGVNDQAIGNVSISLASKQADTYGYYAAHKERPLFSFNILIYGEAGAVSGISSRVLG